MTEVKNVMLDSVSLGKVLSERRSIRGFLNKPIDSETLKAIFTAAQQAPSNCNTQPWHAYVASGDVLHKLGDELYDLAASGAPPSQDFRYFEGFEKEYRDRQFECAFKLYDSQGITRENREGRRASMLRNFRFFDAPHAAFLCMPKPFGEVNALDVGIYLQTLMLVMQAYGVASCAQGALSFYPQPVKAALGIPDDLGIMCGISFGYADPDVPANNTFTTRADLAEVVSFIE